MPAPEPLVAELERLVRKEQRSKRLPSVAAAVVRNGEVIWDCAVGAADVAASREATPDTQYRIGSITKTFTAAAIMQLRDAGQLDLEDTLDRHIAAAAHAPTIRRLLSHTSGLQRETHDEGWLRWRFAPAEELVDTLAQAEQVLPPGARFHYSNLAFALLGVVVERASRIPYVEYVHERLLRPLGLSRLGFDAAEPAAVGYLVQPYVEGVWAPAAVETGAWIAAGQMWGTVGDLARWAAFLAVPDEEVLSQRSAQEMRVLQSLDDHERWTAGYGLGLQLLRDGERILAGHGGSMPGFIAGLAVSPADKIGAVALTNSSGARLGELVLKLIAETVERWPVPPEPWRVEDAPPDEILPLLGIWFLEGDQAILRWRDGTLELRFPDLPEWRPSSVLRREADDLWRTESGSEQGERLRVERDAGGNVERLVWAGYPLLRTPGVWR
ncbi:MAG: serine hydrolase domain-containing protein [Gaiellaceae bacterium]